MVCNDGYASCKVWVILVCNISFGIGMVLFDSNGFGYSSGDVSEYWFELLAKVLIE